MVLDGARPRFVRCEVVTPSRHGLRGAAAAAGTQLWTGAQERLAGVYRGAGARIRRQHASATRRGLLMAALGTLVAAPVASASAALVSTRFGSLQAPTAAAQPRESAAGSAAVVGTGPGGPPEPWVPAPVSLEAVFGTPPTFAGADPAQLRTLVATGDVIPARSVNASAARRGDFLYPYRATADLLRRGDLVVINLEAPLLARCPVTDAGMTFCGDARHAEGLAYAGVGVAGLANNHLGNYGPAGVEETVRVLASKGIAPSGLGYVAYREVRGLTFGVLAFNGVGERVNRAEVTGLIGAARTRADVVVVQCHWGREYTRFPAPAPGVAPDDPREIARLAIDAGADLVLGNHPHWVQGVELYGGGFVAYAHGNFVFDQMWSRETREGVVGRYTFYGRRLAAVEYQPVMIHDFAQPRPAADLDAARILGEMAAASRRLAASPFRAA